jgi:lipoate---protein ligase
MRRQPALTHPPTCHCLADGVDRPKADANGQAVPSDMQLLELTLDTPAENVALDEALLLSAEAGDAPDEVLRIWEPRQNFVVLGSASRIASEVNVEYCKSQGIDFVRRTSGGAAIVAGPGCLMYSLVLSLTERPELRSIDRAHRFVLDSLAAAFDRLVPGVARRGTSDLAIGDRKFSGNSLRLKRRHLLYHGTLLYDFPLDLIGACLPNPPRQPDYRASRAHDEFIVNLPLDRRSIHAAITSAFGDSNHRRRWPSELTAQLTTEKFTADDWTNRI